MATADIVDYAMPLMNIERMAKEIHNKCLEQDFSSAEELTLKLGVEARILGATLAIMQNKDTTKNGERRNANKQANNRQTV